MLYLTEGNKEFAHETELNYHTSDLLFAKSMSKDFEDTVWVKITETFNPN